MQREVTTITCDMLTPSGLVCEKSAETTIDFAYAGKFIVLDLCPKHQAEADHFFVRLMEAGTRTKARKPASARVARAEAPEATITPIGGARPRGRSRRAAPAPTAPTADPAAIREWAAANGYAVADRGRIAMSVVEAYNGAE